jgi:fatty-acyl-CoA synthase
MLDRFSATPGITLLSRSAFEREATRHSPGALPDVDPDVAVLLFTSGTTGEPKAAVLRHQNLSSYVTQTVEFLASEADEASLVCVPPYHIAGIAGILTGIYGGRRMVHLPTFTPEFWLKEVVEERITHAMLVPTMLARILDVVERDGVRLPHLRAVSYGGGRMPQPVIERAMRLWPHVDFVNGYGLTETSSTIAMLTPDDHREAMAAADATVHRRIGSVGRPLPSVEVQIRGPEGEVLPPGKPGEIFVRGAQVSGEYKHKNMLRADGWFATNDGGWMDEKNYLYVEGRLDDIIVRGGENISPGEIEDVLRAHPAVLDVAVFGVPDDEWGERVAAAVVLNGRNIVAEDLAQWIKSKLRSTKTPEVWAFKDALPYNDTGKVLRRELKKEFATERLSGR